MDEIRGRKIIDKIQDLLSEQEVSVEEMLMIIDYLDKEVTYAYVKHRLQKEGLIRHGD